MLDDLIDRHKNRAPLKRDDLKKTSPAKKGGSLSTPKPRLKEPLNRPLTDEEYFTAVCRVSKRMNRPSIIVEQAARKHPVNAWKAFRNGEIGELAFENAAREALHMARIEEEARD